MDNYLDLFLFAALPYMAFALFFVVTIWRYVNQTYSYTSLSSQFLENEFHFWGLVPFHYGLILTLTGHVIAIFLPKQLLLFNSVPLRLYMLETTALVFGLLSLIGVIHIIIRRMKYSQIRIITRPMDWVLYLFLFVMICSGVYVAVFHRWGMLWFASTVTPYLWSLIKFHPEISNIVNLPFAFKLHMICAFMLIAIFPFTKLVHVLVVPNHYFLRKRQVVKWNWDRKHIRESCK